VTEVRPYSVVVALAGGDSSALLSLVSTLHRRRVDVLDAELTRPDAGRRVFAATFLATSRQARTVEASLRNLVDTVDVEMCEAADDRREKESPTPTQSGSGRDRSRPVRWRLRSEAVAG
jgi:hypothetical protein